MTLSGNKSLMKSLTILTQCTSVTDWWTDKQAEFVVFKQVKDRRKETGDYLTCSINSSVMSSLQE